MNFALSSLIILKSVAASIALRAAMVCLPTIQARVKRDSTELSYQGRDTITGVITVRKKRFLFFRWGVKAIEHDISNKNPKSKIDIDIAVKLK